MKFGPLINSEHRVSNEPVDSIPWVRNLRAEQAYRQAWYGWCLCTEDKDKRQLEIVMDQMQLQIAPGPGHHLWTSFNRTLPGYLEFWAGWKAKMDVVIDQMEANTLAKKTK